MTARNPRWTGVIPPVVTPLTADGEIDRPSLERVVGHLLDGGVSGLFVLGSSGETAYLTPGRQDEVIEVITSACAGQVPVLVGAIETTTDRAIERARAAEGLGADAVVATAPFYTRTHPTEIDRHFRDIAAALDLPVLAYDVPVCVHSKLDPELLLPLAADGVLAGVKDSSGDDGSFRRLAIGARELPEFSVLTGHELVVDAMMLAGADGSVPGSATWTRTATYVCTRQRYGATGPPPGPNRTAWSRSSTSSARPVQARRPPPLRASAPSRRH